MRSNFLEFGAQVDVDGLLVGIGIETRLTQLSEDITLLTSPNGTR